MKRLLRKSVNWIPFSWRPALRKIPGLAALQRAIVKHALAGEPFVHTINAGPAAGLRFEITLPKDKAIWAGTHETVFATAIAAAVKKGDVCFDIGGYRGFMTGIMALAGASKVVVFEPLPENQLALGRLCELNPDLPIEIQPAALGGAETSVLFAPMLDDSMGKLVTSAIEFTGDPESVFAVEVRTIDGFMEDGMCSPPAVLKIDVEGAELEVLRGAAGTLNLQRPVVFLEAHSLSIENACIQELESRGYLTKRVGSEPAADDHARHLEARPRAFPQVARRS